MLSSDPGNRFFYSHVSPMIFFWILPSFDCLEQEAMDLSSMCSALHSKLPLIEKHLIVIDQIHSESDQMYLEIMTSFGVFITS